MTLSGRSNSATASTWVPPSAAMRRRTASSASVHRRCVWRLLAAAGRASVDTGYQRSLPAPPHPALCWRLSGVALVLSRPAAPQVPAPRRYALPLPPQARQRLSGVAQPPPLQYLQSVAQGDHIVQGHVYGSYLRLRDGQLVQDRINVATAVATICYGPCLVCCEGC